MKFLLFLLTACTLTAFAAQEPKRITRTFSAGDAVVIREIGAVIVPKNDRLMVDIMLGNHEREQSDVQKDDEVLMANGKKVKTVKDLREQYEGTNIGEEFKIGLKRGEHLFIAKVVKKSDEELNKAGGGMVIRMERKEGEELLPALGLGIQTKGKKAEVSTVLPTAEKNFTAFKPERGDVIVSINGKKVSSAGEFSEAYDSFEEGDEVTIEFARSGKPGKATFKKPKPMGRMIMTR